LQNSERLGELVWGHPGLHRKPIWTHSETPSQNKQITTITTNKQCQDKTGPIPKTEVLEDKKKKKKVKKNLKK
jgi:hypothetical protein